MFKRVRSAFLTAGAAVGTSLVVYAPAFAAGTDVTFDPAEALSIVDSAKTFIITVGLAVLTLVMVAKGIKWARKAG